MYILDQPLFQKKHNLADMVLALISASFVVFCLAW